MSIDYYSVCQGGQAGTHLFFIRPSLATLHIRGSSYFEVAPLYHPLLLWSPSLQVRSCGLYITARFYYYNIILWKALYQARGGDGSLPSPVFGFIKRGEALYHLLCLGFIYGGRLSTAPCVRFYRTGEGGSLPSSVRLYIAGRDGSLPSPVFGIL